MHGQRDLAGYSPRGRRVRPDSVTERSAHMLWRGSLKGGNKGLAVWVGELEVRCPGDAGGGRAGRPLCLLQSRRKVGCVAGPELQARAGGEKDLALGRQQEARLGAWTR